MANPYQNEVGPFKINGNPYTLRASFRIIAEIENALNKGLSKITHDLVAGEITADEIAKILALANLNNYTLEEVEQDLEVEIEKEGLVLIHYYLGELIGSIYFGGPQIDIKKKVQKKKKNTLSRIFNRFKSPLFTWGSR